MRDLAPLCALGGKTPRVDRYAGVTLSENPNLALASVGARMGQETECKAQLAQVIGADAPCPGKAVLRLPELAVWIGPDQWMLAAPLDPDEDLDLKLGSQFAKVASVTEQTDAWVCFDLQGDGIEAVLQLCCNIDIERMRIGDATRTAIHYMGVHVIRTAADALILLGARSSAASLHHALLTAMRAALNA